MLISPPASLRPTLATVLILIGVTLGAAGCAQRETSVEEGIRTKTLLVGNQNEPATFDPHLCDSSTEVYLIAALFEGLTVFDEKTAAAAPGTAERWEVSPDGLVYTFHLRANAKWSNGDRVTARDFAWSFERFLSPGLASPYAYMLWPIRGAEAFTAGKAKDFSAVGIEALGDTALRLTLAQPAPHILTILATAMPLHRASVEQAGGVGDRTSPWARPGKLVGNGAFTLAEWRPGAHVIAAKNPHYWGAATNRLKRVVFLPIEKSDTEELNFRAGQLHVTFDVPPTKIPVYRAEAPERLRLDPQLSTFYVNFNATKPPFTDARVRRAFALALDRAAIAATVFNGAREPARTLVPPSCGGYTGPAGQRDDFAAARELLAAAGFPGGKNFPALPMLVRNDAAMPKVAEVIQAMWRRELGVTITIEPSEQKNWIEAQNTLRHTIAIRGWTADFPDPTNFLDPFRGGVGGNSSGWANPAFDRLLDQAATALDPAARFALLRQAEALLLEDAGLAPLYHGARTYLIHPAVKNWEPAPMGIHRYQLIELWN